MIGLSESLDSVANWLKSFPITTTLAVRTNSEVPLPLASIGVLLAAVPPVLPGLVRLLWGPLPAVEAALWVAPRVLAQLPGKEARGL
eukprot:6941072-Lingulodinium_polyedra.AAC.1